MTLRDRSLLTTEKRNPRSRDIDKRSTLGIVDTISAEDHLVAPAVRRERKHIAAAVDLIVTRLREGGRLIYVGAGTSGRLGVLDAAECPPTFGVPRSLVQGVIAGGRRALVASIEGAEDRKADAIAALRRKRLGPRDVVVGIATSGLTPFVLAAMRCARARRAAVVFLTCSPQALPCPSADVVINPVVGPEVVTGSTRMKAGTATKLVLNTLTTAAMVKLGKVYGNLMVDLVARNAKLRERSERIVMTVTGISRPLARRLILAARGRAKVAIAMHARKVDFMKARKLLARHDEFLGPVIEGKGHESS
ncbi:MAG: N-acetylmuramic acid 6-phosphate etherase [Planctomycetota bacterium]